MQLPYLDSDTPLFPDTCYAFSEPNGLLAAGGQLTPEWLVTAYSQGIFPWFNEGEPILWWSPAPRMVLYPDAIHINRSLSKALQKESVKITINHCFDDVIQHCSSSRQETSGTWITEEMLQAYQLLHQQGYAHAVEVWQQDQLVGGLYGIALGRVFFGESMFSRIPNASKMALAHLAHWLKKWQYKLIDCQVYSDHLKSLGAQEIDRTTFEQALSLHASTKQYHQQAEWQPQENTYSAIYWSMLTKSKQHK